MGARRSGRRRCAALAVVQARDPKFSECDRTQEFLTKSRLSLSSSALLIYVTMVYGPIAAYLVELFPTRIRYTSMSLPHHNLIEGINNRIKVIKRMPYGFRDEAYFFLRIRAAFPENR